MKNNHAPTLRTRRRHACAMLLSLAAAPAFAQSAAPAAAAPPGASDVAAADTTPAPTGFWDRSNLFGSMGGVRDALGARGITLNLQETSSYFYNASGGTARGGAYEGFTQLSVGVDTGKAIGLPGGTFYASGLQIHGTSLSLRNLQVLQTATEVEADASTRLWELWYQQALLDGKADVKIGQQSLDQEFVISRYGAMFVNSTFGWPTQPSVALPAGGPAYPLSSLGVRLRVKPSPAWTLLAGVFDGNPAGSLIGDPQKLNARGTNFNLRSGALLIGEVQYAVNAPPADPDAPQPAGLPGTYKFGAWYQSQHFNDLRTDANGLSLANPASNGVPATHHGNYGFYAIADQMVWRPAADSPRAVGVFAAVMGAPGDRNTIDLGINAGVTLKAPFAGRDNDVAGLAVGYVKIGSHARALDGDTGAFTTPGYPVRRAETVVEATYQYQVTPWWLVQADVQHFFRPSGGIPNPNAPGARIGDETVVGVLTTVTF
ncbi:carbohydrate porin [Burkholderia sp.]|uniref:carbohydrate porin n=1 Tax=Burkholderia sp. TaxID=36773 RepID=UPI0025BFE7E0|nr:carbohydrate porin [Burkholderia sp.]MBS6360296.1 carbohydrate porin [Burkholderia sp.]